MKVFILHAVFQDGPKKKVENTCRGFPTVKRDFLDNGHENNTTELFCQSLRTVKMYHGLIGCSENGLLSRSAPRWTLNTNSKSLDKHLYFPSETSTSKRSTQLKQRLGTNNAKRNIQVPLLGESTLTWIYLPPWMQSWPAGFLHFLVRNPKLNLYFPLLLGGGLNPNCNSFYQPFHWIPKSHLKPRHSMHMSTGRQPQKQPVIHHQKEHWYLGFPYIMVSWWRFYNTSCKFWDAHDFTKAW